MKRERKSTKASFWQRWCYCFGIAQEEENDNNNNDKKAKDCPGCLEKINKGIVKCENWETNRKTKIEEDLKKEECFHEKKIRGKEYFPSLLDPDWDFNKVSKSKRKCSKCQKEYVSLKVNKYGDEKTLTHNCSQKPNNQDDENDNSNNNKIAEKSTVRKYCQTNDIQRLEHDEETGKLIIIYKKPGKPKSELDNLNEELQKIKNYLKKKGGKDSENKRRFLTEDDWIKVKIIKLTELHGYCGRNRFIYHCANCGDWFSKKERLRN